MKNDYSYVHKGRKVLVIIIAVFLFLSTIVLSAANSGSEGGQVLVFGAASLSGIITAIQCFLATTMVVLDYKLGGIMANIFFVIAILINLIVIIAGHNYSPIPGLCYYSATFISVQVIRQGIFTERRNACVDSLTGLSNRRHIIFYIENRVSQKKPFYAIYLDLRRFKVINDTEGHERGDQILKTISSLWEQVDPDNTMLGRLGGDEFLAVIGKDVCEDVEAYTQKYIDAVKDYLEKTGKSENYLSTVAGISCFPEDGRGATDIVRKADIAMLMAKNKGNDIAVRYESAFEEKMLREKHVEKRVKSALDDNQLFVVYQPLFEASSRKLHGFEALIRMKSGSEAPVSPSEFIPVSEKSDLILELGKFVTKRALTDFASIIRANPSLILSINVSMKQLMAKNFVNDMISVINETGFTVNNLEIEITEHCVVDSTDEAIEVISALKDMGVKVSMDDFGTGYSSLSYLTKVPIDLLKIDKSIIDSMGDGEIIGAMASMGHALGCKVIAEGVETEDQLNILKEMNVDMIQGFIWGRPTSIDGVKDML